jgi:hypothetical protein
MVVVIIGIDGVDVNQQMADGAVTALHGMLCGILYTVARLIYTSFFHFFSPKL